MVCYMIKVCEQYSKFPLVLCYLSLTLNPGYVIHLSPLSIFQTRGDIVVNHCNAEKQLCIRLQIVILKYDIAI